MPCREETARLVERRADEASVDDPGPGLVALAEREGRFVALDPLFGRKRKVDPVPVFRATSPAGWVVMWGDSLYRRPPRSKWALKKFSEPAVAIAAEAEISSASVAAATIWAKRYTFPGPSQSMSRSHERA
jgi:hypothetical protein